MTRRQLTQTWPVLAVVALAATLATAQPKPDPKQAEMKRAVLNVSALRPGDKVMAAVELEIKPGFHAQSRTPTKPEFGEYKRYDLTLNETPGLLFGEPIFPAGEEHEYPNLGKLNVYTGKVV